MSRRNWTSSSCCSGFRQLASALRRLFAKGPRRAARVLRLPGRALEPLANKQPDRIDVRDNPLATSKAQRKWNSPRELGDDVQARTISFEEMETPELLRENRIRHRRTFLQRRNHAGRNRRLTQELNTQQLTIALTGRINAVTRQVNALTG